MGASSSTDRVSDGMKTLGIHNSDLKDIWNTVMLPWTITHVANIVALILCVLTSGWIREIIFSESSMFPRTKRCADCCLQNVVTILVLLWLWVMFLLILVLSYVMLIVLVCVAVTNALCDVGLDSVTQLLSLVWMAQ